MKSLTKERIVRASVRLIERKGVEAVSMRGVAGELGVAVMSLYHYVPSKAALLDAVGEWLVLQMDLSADPGADVRDRVRALMRAFRSVTRRYPRCVNLMLTRGVDSRQGLLLADHAVGLARAAGFDPITGARVVGLFLSYAVGSLMRDAGAIKAFANLRDHRPDPHAYPNLAGLSPRDLDPEAEFEFGLDVLISAVTALPQRQDQG